jgi:hypothetical protein
VTTAQGLYLVPNLKPSTYTIKTTVSGFATLEFKELPLGAGHEFSLDLQLQAAGVTESVIVGGTSLTLDTSSAHLGVNVSERDVNSLPVNGRQMSQLLISSASILAARSPSMSRVSDWPLSAFSIHLRNGTIRRPRAPFATADVA